MLGMKGIDFMGHVMS